MKDQARATLTEVCPFCLQEGTWSSLGDNAVYSPPEGHTIEYLDEGRTIRFDACPRNRRILRQEGSSPE